MKRGRPLKLTEADVVEIKQMYANKTDPIGWSAESIAKCFGVSTATIHKALNNGYTKSRNERDHHESK